MDEPSRHVARFLEAIEEARIVLQTTLGAELVGKGIRANSAVQVRPMRIGADGPVVHAVAVCLSASRSAKQVFEYWVDAVLMPDGWQVTAEVYTDAEHGQIRIREFPERRASTLDECLKHIAAAVADLATCGNLVDDFDPRN